MCFDFFTFLIKSKRVKESNSVYKATNRKAERLIARAAVDSRVARVQVAPPSIRRPRHGRRPEVRDGGQIVEGAIGIAVAGENTFQIKLFGFFFQFTVSVPVRVLNKRGPFFVRRHFLADFLGFPHHRPVSE